MLEKIVRRQTYHIANVIFIFLWVIYFVALLNYPSLGIVLERHGQTWSIAYTDLYGEGYRLGLRNGDIIVKIDNKNPEIHPSVQKWHEVGRATVLEIKSGGQLVRTIQIPKPSFLSTLISELPMAILSFSFWFIGVITWLKRPFLVQARVLYWLNWFIGLAIIFAPASSRQLLWGRELVLIFLSIIPPLLINFISVFPVERKNRLIILSFRVLTAISLLVLILLGLKIFGILAIISELKEVLLAEVLLSSIIALGHLVSLIGLPSTKPERNQVFIILTGLAIGVLPFVVLSALPILLYDKPVTNPRITTLFLISIPIACSYVIIKKYLPDGRHMFESVVINLITGVMAASLLSYSFLITGLLNRTDYQTFIILFFQILIVFLLFAMVKVIIKEILNKAIFIKHTEFKKKVDELNDSLLSINEDSLLEELINELKLEWAFMVVEDNQELFLRKLAGINLLKSDSEQLLENYYFSKKNEVNSPTLLPLSFPAEVFLPFSIGNISGGIFLGHRCSRIKFLPEELSPLTLLGYQIGQRLKLNREINSLVQEIKNLAGEMLKAQQRNQLLTIINKTLFRNIEEERKAFAREIHDGPIQLGMEVSRRLKQLSEEKGNNGKAKAAAIQDLIEELIYQLRSFCTDLRPSTLTDLGLIPTVESLCEEIMKKGLLIITLNIVNIDRQQRFVEDVELAAFRFIQEGLNNVLKHSRASKAEVNIVLINDRLELAVNDFGKGFDVSKVEDLFLTGTRLGLIGMKERIEGLEGSFEIRSKQGEGVTIKAIIPIT